MQASASPSCAVVLRTSSPSDARALRELAHKLTYFGSAPLVFEDFSIDGSAEEFRPGSIYFPAAKLLEQHMWHIRELRLDVIMFYDDGEPIESASGIYAALRSPAPQLRRLIVNSGPWKELDDLWFSGEAPLLESFSFSGAIPSSPAFKNARAVHLQHPEVHPRDISASLHRFPRLKSFFFGHALGRCFDAPLAIPASVQRLWLYQSAVEFKNIPHDRIPQITLDLSYQALPEAQLAGYVAALSVSPLLHVDVDGASLRTRDTKQRCRVYTNISPFAHFRGASLYSASSVSLYQAHAFKQQPFADMTSVTTLEFIYSRHSGGFVCVEGPSFDCPALASVVITVPWGPNVPLPYTVRASDVAAFLVQQLGRSADKSIALSIRGARLDPDAPAILNLVSDITVSEAAFVLEKWAYTVWELL